MPSPSPSKPNHANLRVALYGDNGHQLHRDDTRIRDGCAVSGYAEFSSDGADLMSRKFPGAAACEDLDGLLSLPDLDLIVLCSPRRAEQAGHAIRCLEAGVNVLAEKPCATTESDLDRVLAAANATGVVFHEMAGTVFEQPWWAMRNLVTEGVLGDIQQVLVQKSYPYHDGRPTDERVDGGLIAQNAVHALRFVEHVGGVRIADIQAIDSPIGEDRAESDLRMVAGLMGALENGGLFAGVANYCNPPGFGSWGNEMVRIWGTKGMVEAVDGGARTRLVVGDQDRGPFDCHMPAPDFIAALLAEIQSGAPPLLDRGTEIHPTRMVLRAAEDARRRRS